MSETHQHTVFAVALVVAALAAIYDLRTGRIPNWLTLPVLVLAPILHVAHAMIAKVPTDRAFQEGAYSLGGAALCAVVPLLLFRQGAMGGGDVKLLAAIGALLQPMVGVEAEMYGLFAGAILAPAKLAYEGKLFATLKNSLIIGANLFLPKTKQRSIESTMMSWFRLGPAVVVGVLLAAYMHW
jgi:prepilin peptidase CpaA